MGIGDDKPKSAFEAAMDSAAREAGDAGVDYLGRIKTEAALIAAKVQTGLLPVPPVEINGEKITIIEREEAGTFTVNGIVFFETVEKIVRSGKNPITIKISGISAGILANAIDRKPGLKNIDDSMRKLAHSIEMQLDEDCVAQVQVSLHRDDHGVKDGSQIPPPDYIFSINVLKIIQPN